MPSPALRALSLGYGSLTAKSWLGLSAPATQYSLRPPQVSPLASQLRWFASTPGRKRDADSQQSASKTDQHGLDEQESSLEDAVAQQKDKQQRAPWHREGTQLPPVARNRSAGAMTKGEPLHIVHCQWLNDTSPGKLLTTPSRLLKLILPLTTLDKNSDRKDVEPLALLGNCTLQSSERLRAANSSASAPSTASVVSRETYTIRATDSKRQAWRGQSTQGSFSSGGFAAGRDEAKIQDTSRRQREQG